MIIFNTDLDNTLIYSYKHNIGNDKINVEMYQGREVSFITKNTRKLLEEVRKKVLIVPTTTRTQEQYERIELGIGKIKYALVCNGGILLVNGQRDQNWINDTKKMIKGSLDELHKSIDRLELEKRKLEIRFIEEMFVFTKCEEPELVVNKMKKSLDCSLVDVFNNGEKLYIIPKELNKGYSIKRFANYIAKNQTDSINKCIAAGDSEFDISMIENADIGIVPKDFSNQFKAKKDLVQADGIKVFSEELLEYISQLL